MENNIKELENRKALLQLYLHNTDYQAIKFAEGELTEMEYSETRYKRKAWRAEINTIESQIKALSSGNRY